MSPRILSYLLLTSHFAIARNVSCISFGKDFQDGGCYFQNSQSNENFTFVQEFEGCQPDASDNILVDPNGEQLLCSGTPLTPDDTPEMSTCPIKKSELFSGEWSIIVISNNNNSEPIAYQRDFSLSVGPQRTTTYTPTVTVSAPYTPILNSTVIVTDTSIFTGPRSTTTVPSTTITKTTTITPSRVTVRTTHTVLTITKTKPVIGVTKTTSVVTASCSIAAKQNHHDPLCRIKPTLPGIEALALSTVAANPTVGPKLRPLRDRAAHHPLLNKKQFIESRHKRLAHIAKRAPDEPTITVTDTNTVDYVTTTSTSTAAAITITITSTAQATATVTPSPIVVVYGRSTAPLVKTTAPTPTRTITRFAVATSWVTKSWATTLTIISTTTPSSVLNACTRAGGRVI